MCVRALMLLQGLLLTALAENVSAGALLFYLQASCKLVARCSLQHLPRNLDTAASFTESCDDGQHVKHIMLLSTARMSCVEHIGHLKQHDSR